MTISLRGAALCASILVLAACDDPIRPQDIAGEYEAVRMNGAPPPLELATEGACWWSLLEARLTIDESGFFTIDYVEGGGCGQEVALETPGSFAGEYGITGDLVIFRLTHGQMVIPFVGEVSGQRIGVTMPSPRDIEEETFSVLFQRP